MTQMKIMAMKFSIYSRNLCNHFTSGMVEIRVSNSIDASVSADFVELRCPSRTQNPQWNRPTIQAQDACLP